MQNTKSFALLIISAVLAGTFCLSPAISSLMSSINIRSSGQISTDLPTITAASGYWRDIQTAVDWIVAQGGIGNVYIPEGEFDFVNIGEAWTGSKVSIPAGVNLFGAPNSRDANGQNTEWLTVLVMPYDVPGDWSRSPNWFRVSGNSDPAKPTRISDIKLVGYRSIDSSSTTIHRGISVSNVIDFRIDHIFFEHIPASPVSTSGYRCNGVIDHNRFVNVYGYAPAQYEQGDLGYGVEMHRAFSGYTEAQMFEPTMSVIGHYKEYTIFIEDNFFSKFRHCVCAGDGVHYVVRHNTFEGATSFQDVDSHGVYTNYGTRAAEVYDNQFLMNDPTQGQPSQIILAIRGGACIWFNNYVLPTSTYNFLMLVQENDKTANSVWRTTDCYFYAQPTGSRTLSMSLPTGNVAQGADYFVSWSLQTPDPSWRIAGYTPYTYPHPLTIQTEF